MFLKWGLFLKILVTNSFHNYKKVVKKTQLKKSRLLRYTPAKIKSATFSYKTKLNFFEDQSCPESFNKHSLFRKSSLEIKVEQNELFCNKITFSGARNKHSRQKGCFLLELSSENVQHLQNFDKALVRLNCFKSL